MNRINMEFQIGEEVMDYSSNGHKVSGLKMKK